jgi:hypothetical protein
MIIGWPSVLFMWSASTRIRASTAPPAGSATTNVTGRDGKVCPKAPKMLAARNTSVIGKSFFMRQQN